MVGSLRALPLAAILALSLPSCALVLSQQMYRPVASNRESDEVTRRVPSVALGFVWLRAGGHAGDIECSSGDAKWRVHGGEVSSGQHWVGPVLPILPLITGEGASTEDVEVFLEIVEGSLRVVPQEFRARATRRQAGAAPTREAVSPDLCRLTDSHWDDDARALPLGEAIQLSEGQWLQLSFPLPVRETLEFELLLPDSLAVAGGEPWTYRYEDRRLFVWSLLPLPAPSVRF